MTTESSPMTTEQINLVQRSFAKVAPIEETAARLFYGRLFEVNPELRPLFKSDMKEQGQKLMKMLAVAVDGLSRIEEIVPAVEDMGRRHAGYGVKDSHYGAVASALLWTLEQGLGPEFTPEVKEAWTAAYQVLAATMKNGAAQAG